MLMARHLPASLCILGASLRFLRLGIIKVLLNLHSEFLWERGENQLREENRDSTGGPGREETKRGPKKGHHLVSPAKTFPSPMLALLLHYSVLPVSPQLCCSLPLFSKVDTSPYYKLCPKSATWSLRILSRRTN